MKIDEKVDLIKLASALSIKAEENKKKQELEFKEVLANTSKEAFEKDARVQSILDNADNLLLKQKNEKKNKEIEKLMREKQIEIENEVSERFSMRNEQQLKRDEAFRSVLKELF